MELIDIFKILGAIVTVCGSTYGAFHFVNKERKKQEELSDELIQVNRRLEVLTTSLREEVDKYQPLYSISNNAQIAIAADLHSISIPVPQNSPTRLKIIMSNDPNGKSVIGKEFPLNKGLAGRIFNNKKPEFVNNPIQDPQHLRIIDAAAGTNTGEGAILSFPIIIENKCIGVSQFMKKRGGKFSQEDIIIVGRFIEKIAAELNSIEQTYITDPKLGYTPQINSTILFTDINNYSAIAKNINLYQTVSILDEYFNRILNVALVHGATFEEYLGDGIYLSFSDKSKMENANSALLCSLEIHMEYKKLMKEWEDYQIPIAKMNYHNIGIASGTLFEGPIGHPQYRKRKLIGPAVDRAAHLVEKAKKYGEGIMVDQNTFELAKDNNLSFEPAPNDPNFKLLKII